MEQPVFQLHLDSPDAVRRAAESLLFTLQHGHLQAATQLLDGLEQLRQTSAESPQTLPPPTEAVPAPSPSSQTPSPSDAGSTVGEAGSLVNQPQPLNDSCDDEAISNPQLILLAVNISDPAGSTPLLHAAKQGDSQIVGRLLALGASCQAVRPSGNTPLHMAALHGHAKVAAALVRERAGNFMYPQYVSSVHVREWYMHAAALHGHAMVVAAFVIGGAECASIAWHLP